MTPEQRYAAITSAVADVVPDAVFGAFELDDDHLRRLPEGAAARLAPYRGLSVFVFAIPITDDGLWVWHHHGRHRSLLANYVIAKATGAIQRRLGAAGESAIDVWGLTHDEPGVEADLPNQPREQRVSMIELAELAGLGRRGWNNLLLHPEFGAWLQIHAVMTQPVVPRAVRLVEDVCTRCGLCITACPADALEPGAFHPGRCERVVAAPWDARSEAQALTAATYIECRECITSCPIGDPPEGIFQWRR
jgi:ferredoxin